MRSIHIALLCAMPQEIGRTIQNLANVSIFDYGDLRIYSGEWKGCDDNSLSLYLSVAWSGWGKVSAARAATRLIASSLKPIPLDVILFTGVAGAAVPAIKQWDLLIPNQVIQHDMDARPIFQRYVIPAMKKDKLEPDPKWYAWVYSALKKAKESGSLQEFGSINQGLIATGDTFISRKKKLEDLSKEIPGLKAVEMEGAAVAQVAEQEGVPWLIIRVISDEADESAAECFSNFIEKYECFSWDLIRPILSEHKNAPR